MKTEGIAAQIAGNRRKAWTPQQRAIRLNYGDGTKPTSSPPPFTYARGHIDERDVEAAREDGKEAGFIAGMLTTSALWIVIVSALLYFWR